MSELRLSKLGDRSRRGSSALWQLYSESGVSFTLVRATAHRERPAAWVCSRVRGLFFLPGGEQPATPIHSERRLLEWAERHGIFGILCSTRGELIYHLSEIWEAHSSELGE